MQTSLLSQKLTQNYTMSKSQFGILEEKKRQKRPYLRSPNAPNTSKAHIGMSSHQINLVINSEVFSKCFSLAVCIHHPLWMSPRDYKHVSLIFSWKIYLHLEMIGHYWPFFYVGANAL